MMRVGVLTLVGRKFNYNLGAILQAYALQKTLKDLGIDASLIDFTPSEPSLLKIALNKLKQKGFKYIVRRVGSLLKLKLNSVLTSDRKLEAKREEKRSQFINTHFNFTKPFKNLGELSNSELEFDAYIVGSDIVWHPRMLDLEVYLLGFVKSGRKISYAASVAERIPSNLCPLYRKHLLNFDSISVREKTSAKFLSECLGFEPEIVVDPTMLLTAKDWKKLSKKPENFAEKPYILVYDLYRSNEIVPRIIKIAKKNNWEIVCYNYRVAKKYKLTSFYDFDPFEFLWLIQNAESVMTTSFHGTVFSVLFEKPFYSVDPNLSSFRITDFLEMLSLDSRFVQDPAKISSLSFEDVDFSEAKDKIKRERERSLQFLKEALGV
jgi:hypothetical protein